MNSPIVKIGLGLVLLAVFAFWGSREAQEKVVPQGQLSLVALQVALAIAFTLVLFISLVIHLGRVYQPPQDEEEPDDSRRKDLAEDEPQVEEAEAIIVETESEKRPGKP